MILLIASKFISKLKGLHNNNWIIYLTVEVIIVELHQQISNSKARINTSKKKKIQDLTQKYTR